MMQKHLLSLVSICMAAVALVPFDTHVRAATSRYLAPTKKTVVNALHSFESDCGLQSTFGFHDKAIEDYLSRVGYHGWQTNSSPYPILTRIVRVNTSSVDKINRQAVLATTIDRVNQAPQLDFVKVSFDLSAAGFLKAQRTCAERLASQASANFSLFVKTYGSANLKYVQNDALTITGGTWTSDIEDLVQSKDRRLMAWLYDFYRKDVGTLRWAAVSRLTGTSVLRTSDVRSATMLRAALEAGGSLGLFSAGTKIRGSTGSDEKIDFLRTDTLVHGTKEWASLGGASVPIPEIDVALMPAMEEVVKVLKSVTFTHPTWSGAATEDTAIEIYVHGPVASECSRMNLFRCDQGECTALAAQGKFNTAGERCEFSTQESCSKDCQRKFSVRYNELEIGQVTDTLFIRTPVRAEAYSSGRDANSDQPRWTVLVASEKSRVRVQAFDDPQHAFICPGEKKVYGRLACDSADYATSVRIQCSADFRLPANCIADTTVLKVLLEKGRGELNVPIERRMETIAEASTARNPPTPVSSADSPPMESASRDASRQN